MRGGVLLVSAILVACTGPAMGPDAGRDAGPEDAGPAAFFRRR